MCSSKSRLVLIEQHNIGRDKFYTTPLFWDCECERNFIHACVEDVCLVCEVAQTESPNARVDEVLLYSSELNRNLVAALEMICDRVCPDLVSIPF